MIAVDISENLRNMCIHRPPENMYLGGYGREFSMAQQTGNPGYFEVHHQQMSSGTYTPQPQTMNVNVSVMLILSTTSRYTLYHCLIACTIKYLPVHLNMNLKCFGKIQKCIHIHFILCDCTRVALNSMLINL